MPSIPSMPPMQSMPSTVGISRSPTTTTVVPGIALVNALLYQWPLYNYAVQNLELRGFQAIAILVTLFTLVFCTTALMLSLVSLLSHRLMLIVAILIFHANAVALYFVASYKVVLDRTMMGNFFNTNPAEALELAHLDLAMYLVVFGLTPSVLLLLTPSRSSSMRNKLVLILSIVIGFSIVVYTNARTWLWFDHHLKTVGALMMPWSYLVNSVRYQQRIWVKKQRVQPLPALHVVDPRQRLVVLVIGESARAANFSIYGYARQTNPLLSRSDVVPIKNARSCATYTTAAIQCMMTPRKKAYSFREQTESLPVYFDRHNVQVQWLSNNSGEPPMPRRLKRGANQLRQGCAGEHCRFDEVLLSDIDRRLDSMQTGKSLLVLHPTGSHGPAYAKKIPPGFTRFTPTCETVQLVNCSRQSLINAYDNTVLYTDFLLHRLIDKLRERADIASVLIYVSDHGESLGEHGLYLHGTPMAIAPEEQTVIPMIVWMSQAFKMQSQSNPAQMRLRDSNAHEHIFHSIIGALGLTSSAYDPTRNLFRTPP
ncbi:MAG: phosphoethanolamine--lipid A transferase EptA [Burkholderiaceae bacterium]